MFRFFKNIFNAIIIVLVFAGINSLFGAHLFDDIISNCTNYFKNINQETIQKVGDFSSVDSEFNVDTAVNLFGFKAVIAEHKSSGQRLLVIDSGKKSLLTKEDIIGNGLEEKLEDLSNKFKYQSSNVSDIVITSRGYMTAYGHQLPFVKFNASVTKLPISNITAVVAINDFNPHEQRLLISVNEKKKYSQLITNEFYRNVRESK